MGKKNFPPPLFLKMAEEEWWFLETLEPEANTRQGKFCPNQLKSDIKNYDHIAAGVPWTYWTKRFIIIRQQSRAISTKINIYKFPGNEHRLCESFLLVRQTSGSLQREADHIDISLPPPPHGLLLLWEQKQINKHVWAVKWDFWCSFIFNKKNSCGRQGCESGPFQRKRKDYSLTASL